MTIITCPRQFRTAHWLQIYEMISIGY
jgi:hypothetical protein